MQLISKQLSECSKEFHRLTLQGCTITDESLAALTEFVKNTQQITYLDIQKTEECSATIGDFSLVDMAAALETNTSLTVLVLDGQKIWAKDIKHLCAALIKNKSISSLSLNDSFVGTKAMNAIVNLLQQNELINELRLENCGINDEASKSIANVVEADRKFLKRLILNNNEISNEGAKVIAQALVKNKGLLRLELKGNKIDYDGLTSLLEALHKNDVLTAFEVSLHNVMVEKYRKNQQLRECYSKKSASHDPNRVSMYDWERSLDRNMRRITEILQQESTGFLEELPSLEINKQKNLATTLALLIEKNNTLKSINLDNIIFDKNEMIYIVESLEENYTITSLVFKVSSGCEDVAAKAEKIVSRNNDIKNMLEKMSDLSQTKLPDSLIAQEKLAEDIIKIQSQYNKLIKENPSFLQNRKDSQAIKASVEKLDKLLIHVQDAIIVERNELMRIEKEKVEQEKLAKEKAEKTNKAEQKIEFLIKEIDAAIAKPDEIKLEARDKFFESIQTKYQELVSEISSLEKDIQEKLLESLVTQYPNKISSLQMTFMARKESVEQNVKPSPRVSSRGNLNDDPEGEKKGKGWNFLGKKETSSKGGGRDTIPNSTESKDLKK